MSQQGKPYTPEEKAQIIESLIPHLELGFTRQKACELVGFDPTTLSKWAKNDAGVSSRLLSAENMTTALAMANIHMAIQKESESPDDVRKENSWKWAERKEQTLKPKQDVTSDNAPIQIQGFNFVRNDTNDNTDKETGESLG